MSPTAETLRVIKIQESHRVRARIAKMIPDMPFRYRVRYRFGVRNDFAIIYISVPVGYYDSCDAARKERYREWIRTMYQLGLVVHANLEFPSAVLMKRAKQRKKKQSHGQKASSAA